MAEMDLSRDELTHKGVNYNSKDVTQTYDILSLRHGFPHSRN